MGANARLWVGLAIGWVFMVPASSRAALLEAEPFDYPGDLGAGLNTRNGGTGWSGAWTDTDSLPTLATTNASLSYPVGVPLTPTGARVETSTTATNNAASRGLGTTMDLSVSGQTFYSSALFRRSAVAGELTSVLFDRTSDSAIRWYYGIDTNGFFSTAVNPSDTTQRVTSTTAAAANTTYFLVARLRTNTGPGGNDQVFLEIFPEGSTVTEPATDADWDLTTHGNSGIVLERLRLAMSNTAGQTNQFDEFRVGTTFADVTGVPEPAGAAILALAATAALTPRRRRN